MKNQNDILENAIYIQASESYCIAYFESNVRKVNTRPVKFYSQKLEDLGWCRIHRSYLVNPEFVSNVSDDYDFVHLMNGKQLPISRRKKSFVQQWKFN